jgi:nucleoside-diphosphate-sugar epimerase
MANPFRCSELDSIRDFLDVSDIVAAYFALLDAPSLPFSAFNVASGQPTSISDVVRATARILHKPIGEVLFSAQGNSADDTSIVVGDAQRLRTASRMEASRQPRGKVAAAGRQHVVNRTPEVDLSNRQERRLLARSGRTRGYGEPFRRASTAKHRRQTR